MPGEYGAYCACDNGYIGYNCDTSELCVLQDTFFVDEAVLVVDRGLCAVWEGRVCA